MCRIVTLCDTQRRSHVTYILKAPRHLSRSRFSLCASPFRSLFGTTILAELPFMNSYEIPTVNRKLDNDNYIKHMLRRRIAFSERLTYLTSRSCQHFAGRIHPMSERIEQRFRNAARI